MTRPGNFGRRLDVKPSRGADTGPTPLRLASGGGEPGGPETENDRPPEKPDWLKREWPRYLRKARVISMGLWHAGHDFNVAYKMVLSAVVLVLAGVTGEWLDLAVVAGVTGLMLTGELFNTAVEQLCDVVSPEHDERIGAVKDVAAAAAGTAMVFWFIVIVLEAVRLVERAF
jgi:diacylglycerol kinase (ATP)